MSTHGFRTAWLAALFFASCTAFAADLQAVAVEQVKPGSVTVTVRSPDDHPAPEAFHLHLTSNGTDKSVAASGVSPAPGLSADLATSVIICIDRSGSMQRAVQAIKAALHDVLATPRPDLRIAILSFGSDIAPLSAFSSDPAEALRVVGSIRAEGGRDGTTKLFDAIAIAMSRLANDPARGPKRLIVISDGKDEGSRMPRETLIAIAQKRAAPIDSIAFGPLAPKWSGVLGSLSATTGGKFVLVDSTAALSDAIRNDLGTTQPPAFNVTFDYDAQSGAAPASAAALEYAVPGRAATLIPISVALAVPAAAPVPASEPASAASAVASAVAPPASEPVPLPDGKKSWLDASFTLFNITINAKGLLAGLLALLACILVIVFTKRRTTDSVAVPPSPPPKEDRTIPRGGTMVSAMFPPPSPGHPTAYLTSGGGRKRVTRYPIEKATTRVGADEHNDFVVTDDEFVSRKHASIRYEAGTLYLSDLGSSNGTFRNDMRLGQASVALAPGDVIRFGRTSYEVHGIDDGHIPTHSSEHERRVP